MKLVLFTTKVDRGGREIIKEARKMLLACQIYFCEELSLKNGEIFNLNLNPLSIHQGDKIILRDPYNTTRDYTFFTKKILEKYYKNILLDRERYLRFPLCQDKLFQANLFIKLGITTPEVFFGRNLKKPLKFPVIVKPRIGSRARGIRIFEKAEELRKFFVDEAPRPASHDVVSSPPSRSEILPKQKCIYPRATSLQWSSAKEDKDAAGYIVQKYHKVKNEYRILLLKHNILGIVDKNIYLNNKGRVRVTINKVVNTLPEKIVKDAVRITKALKADFVGIDVIHAEDGEYYFLEANFSPQFNGFAKVTKINVANRVIRLVLT